MRAQTLLTLTLVFAGLCLCLEPDNAVSKKSDDKNVANANCSDEGLFKIIMCFICFLLKMNIIPHNPFLDWVCKLLGKDPHKAFEAISQSPERLYDGFKSIDSSPVAGTCPF